MKLAKATLYAKFADKEAIVEAVLRRESDRTITDEQLAESLSMELDEALLVFGRRYMAFINERRLGGWDRLIAAMPCDIQIYRAVSSTLAQAADKHI